MPNSFQVLIVGGGAAGISVAASLKHRDSSLRIAIVEPTETHVYQPGQTLVGRGVMSLQQLKRPVKGLIPAGVEWIKASVTGFSPDTNEVTLDNNDTLGYEQLVVCLGLKLDLEGIEGLTETLGKNGVTSNYITDLSTYTWDQVQKLTSGRALFTQPPMPIKCAGAPQKAMYLSCDFWKKESRLSGMEVEFHNAGAVMFGVAEFVPVLESYVKDYGIKPRFGSTLVKVDGPAKKAWFKQSDGNIEETTFDLLHVTPPQCAPDVVAQSALANEAGWVEVDQTTLQHSHFKNIFSLGDVCSAPNAKTAAAVRKQVPIVADNLIAARKNQPMTGIYDGYGACPLTVEVGKVVLAEFGYGGSLKPSFPLDAKVPSRFYWWMKTTGFPWVYWHLMMRGREWLVKTKP
jgi:sulfide:quinone oxidoreductase